MSDSGVKIDRDDEVEASTSEQAVQPVDDWEIEEVVARFDRVSERGGTKGGGSTSCH
jgi:hypothetical protein